MFKAGVLGCGLIATEKYIPIINDLKNRVKLVGICDLDESVLKNASMKFRVTNTYNNFNKMLSEQKPDFVVVCTPPASHKNLAIEIMKYGSDILVEKPMALSVSECDEMIDASMKYNKKIGVMHNQIFNPAIIDARSKMTEAAFGKFQGMRIFMATRLSFMTSISNHWAHKLPGGVLGETGPHAVYLSLAFLNQVENINICYKKLLPEYPWSLAEDIRFDVIADNAISSVALTYGSVQSAAEVVLIGTKGFLIIDLQSRTLINHDRPNTKPVTIAMSDLKKSTQLATQVLKNGVKRIVSPGRLDSHFIGVNKFLDYLEGNSTYPATGMEGKKTVSVLERLVRKMQVG